jgi:hypothetical protein
MIHTDWPFRIMIEKPSTWDLLRGKQALFRIYIEMMEIREENR